MRLAFALMGCGLLAGCTQQVASDPDAKNAPVKPRVVTTALPHDTDDPAIWINRADPAKSLVVGTDKATAGGLYVFDLAGKIVAQTPVLKRPNNVDIVTGLMLAGKPTDIAVTTEREMQRLRVFRLPDLAPLDKGDLVVFAGDVTRAPMGVALYRRPGDGAVFAIVGGKSGPAEGYLWQYRLEDDGTGLVKMTKVRAFGRYSGKKEIEAIAVDAELGYIYYSDEQHGVHKYRADPDAPEAGQELALFGTAGFASDLEGISIYPRAGGAGYLVVSNQQADTFRIFPRAGTAGKPHDHPLLKSVRLATRESDGSEVTNVTLPGFPGGLFVAMSTDRTFHFYARDDIVAAAGLQCLLDDQPTEMILNTDDFWECPKCRLQARSGGGVLVMLRTRGNGDLKDTKATSSVVGWFLGKADSDDPIYSKSSPVQNKPELREFLSHVN